MRCMDCMVADTSLKLDSSLAIPDILAVDPACCTHFHFHFHCMGDNVHRTVAVAVAVVEAVVAAAVEAVAEAAVFVSVVAVVESDQHTGTHLVPEVFLPLCHPLEQPLFQTAPTTSSCHDDKHKRLLATDAQPIFHRQGLCAFAHSPGPDNSPDNFAP